MSHRLRDWENAQALACCIAITYWRIQISLPSLGFSMQCLNALGASAIEAMKMPVKSVASSVIVEARRKELYSAHYWQSLRTRLSLASNFCDLAGSHTAHGTKPSRTKQWACNKPQTERLVSHIAFSVPAISTTQ